MLHRNRYKPPKPIKPWTGPKPKLPMQVMPTCRVHFRDLQDYLKVIFRMQSYDVSRNTGAIGGMTPEFIVTGVMPDTPNIWQQIDNIRRGRGRNLGLILDLLCSDGFIPAGKYVIDMTMGPDPLDQYRAALHRTSDPLDIECMTLKRTHRTNNSFVKQVAMLDKRVLEYKSKLRTEPTDG